MIKKLLWIILWLLINSTSSSYGFIVTINLIWNYPLSTYNLEEGSIVQVITYDHKDSLKPIDGAINNFDEIEPNVFDSNTTPFNHDIIATSTLDDETFSISFEILDSSYSRLYIRIIESIDSDTSLSHWGLTTVHNIPHNDRPWTTTWYDTCANQETTFIGNNYFEVIPEPNIETLIILGLIMLIVCSMWCFTRV